MFELRPSAWISRALILLAFFVLTLTSATAQVTTGSLQGVVRDPNGAAVAGAPVKVTNTETGISRETTTNDEGFYRVTNLTPGQRYRVEVTATGFAPTNTENVVVNIATENSVDVTVGVAQVGETVQVVGEASLLNQTQNQLTQNYTTQQLTQLPYTGSIDNLALLTPGVVTPGDADFTNGVGISANGNRARSNNFQIDGQDNNDNSVAGPSYFMSNQDLTMKYEGPATELSLFAWPSMLKLLERPRWPFIEMPAPLVFEKPASPVEAAPGTSSARASNPVPTGRSVVWRASNVLPICAVVVSMSGAEASTVTVSVLPTLSSTLPWSLITPDATFTPVICFLLKPCASTFTV